MGHYEFKTINGKRRGFWVSDTGKHSNDTKAEQDAQVQKQLNDTIKRRYGGSAKVNGKVITIKPKPKPKPITTHKSSSRNVSGLFFKDAQGSLTHFNYSKEKMLNQGYEQVGTQHGAPIYTKPKGYDTKRQEVKIINTPSAKNPKDEKSSKKTPPPIQEQGGFVKIDGNYVFKTSNLKNKYERTGEVKVTGGGTPYYVYASKGTVKDAGVKSGGLEIKESFGGGDTEHKLSLGYASETEQKNARSNLRSVEAQILKIKQAPDGTSFKTGTNRYASKGIVLRELKAQQSSLKDFIRTPIGSASVQTTKYKRVTNGSNITSQLNKIETEQALKTKTEIDRAREGYGSKGDADDWARIEDTITEINKLSALELKHNLLTREGYDGVSIDLTNEKGVIETLTGGKAYNFLMTQEAELRTTGLKGAIKDYNYSIKGNELFPNYAFESEAHESGVKAYDRAVKNWDNAFTGEIFNPTTGEARTIGSDNLITQAVSKGAGILAYGTESLTTRGGLAVKKVSKTSYKLGYYTRERLKGTTHKETLNKIRLINQGDIKAGWQTKEQAYKINGKKVYLGEQALNQYLIRGIKVAKIDNDKRTRDYFINLNQAEQVGRTVTAVAPYFVNGGLTTIKSVMDIADSKPERAGKYILTGALMGAGLKTLEVGAMGVRALSSGTKLNKIGKAVQWGASHGVGLYFGYKTATEGYNIISQAGYDPEGAKERGRNLSRSFGGISVGSNFGRAVMSRALAKPVLKATKRIGQRERVPEIIKSRHTQAELKKMKENGLFEKEMSKELDVFNKAWDKAYNQKSMNSKRVNKIAFERLKVVQESPQGAKVESALREFYSKNPKAKIYGSLAMDVKRQVGDVDTASGGWFKSMVHSYKLASTLKRHGVTTGLNIMPSKAWSGFETSLGGEHLASFHSNKGIYDVVQEFGSTFDFGFNAFTTTDAGVTVLGLKHQLRTKIQGGYFKSRAKDLLDVKDFLKRDSQGAFLDGGYTGYKSSYPSFVGGLSGGYTDYKSGFNANIETTAQYLQFARGVNSFKGLKDYKENYSRKYGLKSSKYGKVNEEYYKKTPKNYPYEEDYKKDYPKNYPKEYPYEKDYPYKKPYKQPYKKDYPKNYPYKYPYKQPYKQDYYKKYGYNYNQPKQPNPFLGFKLDKKQGLKRMNKKLIEISGDYSASMKARIFGTHGKESKRVAGKYTGLELRPLTSKAPNKNKRKKKLSYIERKLKGIL